MEIKEPKSWAGAMLKHVQEQQKLATEAAATKPEQTITIKQLIEILAVIGDYDISISSRT